VKTISLLILLIYAPHSPATESIGLPPPEKPLSLLVYKMEVLNYCGLIDDGISKAFKQQRDHIIESQNLIDEDVQIARMEGWKFGLAEWQNRGLGGFRNWCETDGREIVEYFRNSSKPTGVLRVCD
jgi:hypothetical protein